MAEVSDHLSDAALDLRQRGFERLDAERIAVERFGDPERERFAESLAAHTGAGVRLWGLAAFVVAIATGLALGLVGYGAGEIDGRAAGILLLPSVVVYGLACLKARSFALAGATVTVLALIVMAASLATYDADEIGAHENAYLGHGERVLVAANRGAPIGGHFEGRLEDLSQMLASADERAVTGWPESSWDEVRSALERGDETPVDPEPPSDPGSRLRLGKIMGATSGLSAFGYSLPAETAWPLSENSPIPTGARMPAAWLLAVVSINAAAAWISRLERAQRHTGIAWVP